LESPPPASQRRVGDQPQIAQHVLDLAPFVEADTPDHLIGDPFPSKRVFQDASLRIRAIEDCRRGIRKAGSLPQARLDLSDDPARFVVLVERLEYRDRITSESFRTERFPLPVDVLRDDMVRRVEDSLRGAVITLETDRPRRGERILEVEDVPDVGPSPTVDRLIVVSDHHEVGVSTGHEFDEAELRPIRVLILIN